MICPKGERRERERRLRLGGLRSAAQPVNGVCQAHGAGRGGTGGR